MLFYNFAAAVVTVVLRGLVERVFAARPIVKSPLIPASTSFLLISGTLFLLYNRLVKGRTIQVIQPSVNHRKILDGRLHKKECRATCASRRRLRRRRNKCMNNRLQTTKKTLELLHNDASSSPMHTKSVCFVKHHRKDSSVLKTEIKECSPKPNVCCMKSEGQRHKKTDEKCDDRATSSKGLGAASGRNVRKWRK